MFPRTVKIVARRTNGCTLRISRLGISGMSSPDLARVFEGALCPSPLCDLRTAPCAVCLAPAGPQVRDRAGGGCCRWDGGAIRATLPPRRGVIVTERVDTPPGTDGYTFGTSPPPSGDSSSGPMRSSRGHRRCCLRLRESMGSRTALRCTCDVMRPLDVMGHGSCPGTGGRALTAPEGARGKGH